MPALQQQGMEIMNEVILIGMLCKHSIRMKETRLSDVLFLHNEELPLSTMISDVAKGKEVSLGYFASNTEVTKDEALEHVATLSMGLVKSSVDVYGSSYSEVTPDICWETENEFYVGGHDLNRELTKYVGKWLVMFVRSNN